MIEETICWMCGNWWPLGDPEEQTCTHCGSQQYRLIMTVHPRQATT